MGPIFLFIVANYLVCAVSNGEGKFKDVYKSTIYALSPLLVFWPIVVVISRYLTLNEAFIYEASMSILILWSGLLMFFMIKDIHNYGVLETIKNHWCDSLYHCYDGRRLYIIDWLSQSIMELHR